MSGGEPRVWLQRFLSPRHARHGCATMVWHCVGEADTPGEDASCRLYLAFDSPECRDRIAAAAFAAFGPPVVLACADWACEWLHDRTIDGVRSLSVQDFEQALALAPGERYAALLVIDALASALGFPNPGS